VTHGGIEFGRDAGLASEVTRRVRDATRLPIWVKMSPEAGDLVGVGSACQAAGADALTAINTVRGMSIDVHTKRLRLANRTGGMSGPALKPIAIRMVWELARAVSIPIIGIGGAATAEDVIEFMLAGASAVQLGTVNFYDPCAAIKAVRGLAEYCKKEQLSAQELIGRAE